MNEPKWTPGPWHRVIKMEGFTAVGADALIARVFSPTFRDLPTEGANARLVAAAPDMYDALEHCVAELQVMQHKYQPVGGQGSLVAKAICRGLSAIAKARGEA